MNKEIGNEIEKLNSMNKQLTKKLLEKEKCLAELKINLDKEVNKNEIQYLENKELSNLKLENNNLKM